MVIRLPNSVKLRLGKLRRCFHTVREICTILRTEHEISFRINRHDCIKHNNFTSSQMLRLHRVLRTLGMNMNVLSPDAGANDVIRLCTLLNLQLRFMRMIMIR